MTVLAQSAPSPDFDLLDEAFGVGYKFGSTSTIADFFNRGIVNIIFFIAGAAFLFYLITSGISMMTSKGDPKALEAAKAKLTQALTGFIIIFTAYWIVQVVGLLLGLDGFGGIFN